MVDKEAACAAVSVIVCAYTELRWEQTRAALASALAQCPAPAEVLLVVDHNAGLSERARAELGRFVPGQSAGDQVMLGRVRILDSDGPPGLSGARNCGMRAASQPITASASVTSQQKSMPLVSTIISPQPSGFMCWRI